MYVIFSDDDDGSRINIRIVLYVLLMSHSHRRFLNASINVGIL